MADCNSVFVGLGGSGGGGGGGGLDPDIQAALDAANAPDADNPFATMADVGGGGGGGAALVDLTGSAALVLTSVAGAATVDASWPVPGLDKGLLIRLLVSASASTSITVELYSAAARTSSDLLYQAVGVNGVAGYDDRMPVYVETSGGNLYARVINTTGVSSDVTLSAYALGE